MKKNLKCDETNDIDFGMPAYCHLEDANTMFNEIEKEKTEEIE